MTDTYLPKNECSACGSEVLARRPSRSGKHWCNKPTCRAAKARFYRKKTAGTDALEAEKRQRREDHKTLITLLTAALHGDRVECPECGREDAIPEAAHPTPAWDGACTGTGLLGVHVNQDFIAAVWPMPVATPF